jgi:hypothetical protein
VAGNTTGTKGNPASKRMGNAALKARRASSWLRGQRRKAERAKAQKARQEKNASLRESGEPTPWEQAKARRAERRRLDPEVQKRAAKYAA